MSQVKLSGNASGSGSVTLASPNTNSAYTVTLPAATGTMFTTADVATQADQETATSTTTIVTPARQQYHPSAAKAWVKANSSGTALVSYNIASITDSGPGAGVVNIDTDFSSANYAVSACFETVSGMITGCIRSITAGSFGWYTSANAVDTSSDVGSYQFSCFGDQ